MSHLDRYMDDFGGRLADAARRPRRPRRRLVVAVAAVAATAATLAGVLTGSTRPLDPVAEAREALAAPGHIVYMKVTSGPADGAQGAEHTVELWSATDPPRWRLVQTLPEASGTMADEHGPIRGRQEFSYARGEQRVYIAERDTLEITQGFSDDGPAALVPSPLNLGSGDIQTDLRTMLRDGEVADLGEQEAGGRTVRRLVSEIEAAGDAPGRRLVYDVDPDSFEPIQARFTITLPGGGPPFESRMRVDAYERIPIDETTLKLLEIRTTPRTEVTVNTAQDVRERAPVPPPDPPKPP